MQGARVWVLRVDHRHGEDVYVHQTEEGARDSLEGYCRLWWNEAAAHIASDEGLDEEPEEPTDRDELITRYFEAILDEQWSIEPQVLGK